MQYLMPYADKIRPPCNQHCDLHCLFGTSTIIQQFRHSLGDRYGLIRHQTYTINETIYRQNQTTDYVVCIRSGLVKLEDVTDEGKARIFFLAGPGHIVGVSALIAEPMRHNAVAINNIQICKVPISLLQKLYTEQPELCINLMQHWQLNLDLVDQCIANFTTGNLSLRLANLILFLIHMDIITPSKMKTVRLLSLSDMAALLAVTPETVCRELAKLKCYKILKKLKRQEYLYEYEGLKSISNGLFRLV